MLPGELLELVRKHCLAGKGRSIHDGKAAARRVTSKDGISLGRAAVKTAHRADGVGSFRGAQDADRQPEFSVCYARLVRFSVLHFGGGCVWFLEVLLLSGARQSHQETRQKDVANYVASWTGERGRKRGTWSDSERLKAKGIEESSSITNRLLYH